MTATQKRYLEYMNLCGPSGLTVDSQRRLDMKVDHQTFDWIFFAIVAIPFLIGLVQLAVPDWLEPLIRDR